MLQPHLYEAAKRCGTRVHLECATYRLWLLGALLAMMDPERKDIREPDPTD